ncbi:unnamed protein product [Escherichia coli]|nr:unnamed protein product [Escherichia coli]
MAGENKLSDKALKALHGKPQPRQKMVADGRGLSVRVSVSGTVSFVVTNGAIVIHTQRLKSDLGGNLLS